MEASVCSKSTANETSGGTNATSVVHFDILMGVLTIAHVHFYVRSEMYTRIILLDLKTVSPHAVIQKSCKTGWPKADLHQLCKTIADLKHIVSNSKRLHITSIKITF